MKYKKYNSKVSFLWTLIIIVFVGTFFVPNPNLAQAAILGELEFKMLIAGLASFLHWLIGLATLIIASTIDAGSFNAVMAQPAIEESWKLIRDILNLAFILVLLFSAFATIFQIEKYHIKKIILLLVIMALLVNFSFPISRFVIDAANIPMYWLAENVFGGGGNQVSTEIGAKTGIDKIVVPDVERSNFKTIQVAQLFSLVFFLFIFLITIIALAFMFFIRLIVLIILVIFSPLGFVAAIFPSTKNYADDYWKALFRNAFFGPIMMLMLAISISITVAFQNSSFIKLDVSEINTTNSQDANAMATAAFFFVPVVLLWGGMIWSQKLGAVGASVVMRQAQRFSNPANTWRTFGRPAWRIARPTAQFAGNVVSGGRLNRGIDYARGVGAGMRKAYVTDKNQARQERVDTIAESYSGRMPWGGRSGRNPEVADANAREMEIKQTTKRIEDERWGASRVRRVMNDADASTTDRLAAARHLSKNKEISTGQELSDAVTAANQDPETLKEILRNAPKEAFAGLSQQQLDAINTQISSLQPKIDLNPHLEQADIVNEVNKLQATLRNKLSEKRTSLSPDELARNLNTINATGGNENDLMEMINNAPDSTFKNIQNSNQVGELQRYLEGNDNALNALRSKLEKQGKFMEYLESEAQRRRALNTANNSGTTDITQLRTDIIRERVTNMDTSVAKDQDASFFTDADVRNIVRQWSAGKQQDLGEKLSEARRQSLGLPNP